MKWRIDVKPKYTQVGCPEKNRISLAQTRAVLKYRPDIVLLEYPCVTKTPDMVFNRYAPDKKPLNELATIKRSLEKIAKNTHGWTGSDIRMWDNIASLWEHGKNTLVYKIDAPPELTSEFLEVWKDMYPCAQRNWLWWVQIYLRERYMTDHLQYILSRHEGIRSPRVLVFLQNFHWLHVKYLMRSPSKKAIWNYYFGKFSEIDRRNIAAKIKENSEVLYRYWMKKSDFR